ncbi:hypothetical protein FVEG_17711 [Fusarium verticillioides 7600]|uniref:Uncharacterized protein n=1 Tax=Gibberella moniliformis (strain M3125 / FGSC 7600) TaxID=334819 RepID=W7MXW5_GIBM7|nr:hypothetical protein FVEG_17711 [Fusarium verticillioides 7600]EWG55943.1 hypothetical protein FVEG_17711 [Fusarium verticillioides 7600]
MLDWLLSRCRAYSGERVRYPAAVSLSILQYTHTHVGYKSVWSCFSKGATRPGFWCLLASRDNACYEIKPRLIEPGTGCYWSVDSDGFNQVNFDILSRDVISGIMVMDSMYD